MKYFWVPMVAAWLAVTGAARADDNRVTVYNQNLGLVKQVRTVTVKKSEMPLRFSDVAARLIPTSVHLRTADSGPPLRVLEQNFEYDLVSAEKILHKYIDHPVEIIRENGERVAGTLLSMGSDRGRESLVLRTDADIKVLAWNDRMSVNVGRLPQGLITRPTLLWHLDAGPDRDVPLEVSYLTAGMNWQAEYVGVLTETADRLLVQAWVSVTNECGASFEDAHLKLVAGEIHRAKPHLRRKRPRGNIKGMATAQATPDFEEREFFEYHIYELERRTTLKNNQIKQIALFPESGVGSRKQFVFNAHRHPRKVEVRLVFANTAANGLGRPLPAGIFRIYQKDRVGLEFVGEDRIDHTARKEEVKIRMGKAFDLAAERRMLRREKISSRSERQTIEIELRNRKTDRAVEILVEEALDGRDWELEEANFPYVQKDAFRLEFTVPVKADHKELLRYTLVYSW